MTTLIPMIVLLTSVTAAAGASPEQRYHQQWPAEVPTSAPAQRTLTDLIGAMDSGSRAQDPWERALQHVFVVPGPDAGAEQLVQIREDMAVMCPILHKALVPLQAQRGAGAALWMNSPDGVFFTGGRLSTQGLYLAGYGALFFVDVDFPLVPPPQDPAAAELAPSGDSVWSATVNELRGVPPEQRGDSGPRYDPTKVESLKSTAIKTLRHAANLRIAGTDAIVVVVGTQMGQTGFHGGLFPGGPSWSQPSREDELQAVLILRTTKADVDAFANGQLTQEQFAGRVQVLTSWTSAGPQAASGSGSRSTVVVPSRSRY